MTAKQKKETSAHPGTGEQQPSSPLEQPSLEQTAIEQPNSRNQQPSAKQAAAEPNRLDIVVQITCCLLQTPRYAGEYFHPERRAIVIAKAIELTDEIIAATAS